MCIRDSLTGLVGSAGPVVDQHRDGGELAGEDLGWSNAAAAAGLILLVIVFLFNLAAILLRNRFEKVRVGT